MTEIFKDEHEQFCYNLGYQEAQKEFKDKIKVMKKNILCAKIGSMEKRVSLYTCEQLEQSLNQGENQR